MVVPLQCFTQPHDFVLEANVSHSMVFNYLKTMGIQGATQNYREFEYTVQTINATNLHR
jgi:hypothetical protein